MDSNEAHLMKANGLLAPDRDGIEDVAGLRGGF
jgi:hypothetical protein